MPEHILLGERRERHTVVEAFNDGWIDLNHPKRLSGKKEEPVMNASGITSQTATADNHASANAAEDRRNGNFSRNRKFEEREEVNGRKAELMNYGLENGEEAATGRGERSILRND